MSCSSPGRNVQARKPMPNARPGAAARASSRLSWSSVLPDPADEAEAAGGADRARELASGHPGHRGGNDRDLQVEAFGQPCPQHPFIIAGRTGCSERLPAPTDPSGPGGRSRCCRGSRAAAVLAALSWHFAHGPATNRPDTAVASRLQARSRRASASAVDGRAAGLTRCRRRRQRRARAVVSGWRSARRRRCSPWSPRRRRAS